MCVFHIRRGNRPEAESPMQPPVNVVHADGAQAPRARDVGPRDDADHPEGALGYLETRGAAA